MCTEVFLAMIYFLIIFLVNYFLFKLLTQYLKNFFILEKIEKSLSLFSKKKQKLSNLSNLTPFFYIHSKKFYKNKNFFFRYSKHDVLIMKNSYTEFNGSEIIKIYKNAIYFFKLLEMQLF